jgi:tetratricopeptide (TPR) repeat protein
MKNYQWAFLTLCLQLVACTNIPQEQSNTPPAGEETQTTENPEPEKEEVVEIPTRPFPADSFYDLLVAEFAVRRSRYDLALGNYLQQSHETRDAGVTARATRLAQFLSADKATLDAALLWVELEPDNLEAQYTAATILAKSKRPIEAIKHMILVLDHGGKTNFAAIAASALPEPEATRLQLESELDKQLAKHPQHAQLLTAKSLLLQQRGELEPALATIRQVLTIDNDDLHATIVEARLLQQLKRPEEAFVRLEQVVQRHPDNRRLRLHYARMLMSKDIKLAKAQFEILLKKSPKDADLLLSLALINKETGQLHDAKLYFERLLELDQRTSEAHYYLGQLAEQNKEWETAIEHYKTIPAGMDFLAAINRITSLYLKQGRIQTARDYVTELREQHPQHAVRLYLIESEILLASQQLEQGSQLLTEALLIHPQQANLLYARSVFSEKRHDLALMEQDLRQIIAQDENNAVALNALGYVLANRTSRLDEAYQLISRALETKPDDPAIIDSLGWVEYRRGNLQHAHQLLKKAYAAYPDHEVAAHLGEVLWALGQQQEARKVWQQALKTKPQSTQLNETMLRLTGEKPSAETSDPEPQPESPTAAPTKD